MFYVLFLCQFLWFHANPFPLETGRGASPSLRKNTLGKEVSPRFPWALMMTSMKHTVSLIGDFEAPLVDIQVTLERDFHCGSVNFQANFASTLRPTNDNLLCRITALLHFDFYEVKLLTSLRILKLSRKTKQINTFRDACTVGHC